MSKRKIGEATKVYGVRVNQAKEESVDIDYLPRARLQRRKPLLDEFDRECGYAYEHSLMFVTFLPHGDREYECSNCGERLTMDYYNCDPDIHEVLEVGALELAFQPFAAKSLATLRQIADDRRSFKANIERRRRKTFDELEQEY